MKEHLTTGEVAKLLSCSKQWVSHLAREGTIKSYRLQDNGWHNIQRSSLEEYVATHNIPVDWSVVDSK